MFVYYYKYFPKMKLASKLTCFCDVIRQSLRLAEHTTKPLYFIGPYLALEVGAVVEHGGFCRQNARPTMPQTYFLYSNSWNGTWAEGRTNSRLKRAAVRQSAKDVNHECDVMFKDCYYLALMIFFK